MDSDVSARKWCQENGVALSTLSYWRRKLAQEEGDTGKWVDIATFTPQAIEPSTSTAIVKAAMMPAILHIGAVTIEVDRTTDPEALEKALIVATSLC
jgi:transposase-like protein